MSDAVRRVTVVGVDGCGKSSFVQRLRETTFADRDVASITCPDFHDTRNAPLQALSRQLKAFSDAADVIGSPAAKASALYLQMTLYGPVEQFFIQTYSPDVLVCERHPVVESLVYGPLYVQLGRHQPTASDDEKALRVLLEQHEPGTMGTILDWYRRHAARCGLAGGLWDVLRDVAELVEQGPEAALRGFGARYQTTLPDDVLWLDAAPELAARRCAARSESGQLEAHETPERLAFLRERYRAVRGLFEQLVPGTRFHVIEASDETSPDALVAAAAAALGFA
jgi:thymidylate kinase